MSLRYWEDFNPGDTFEFGPRTITREEIIEFASEFDPQPFHLEDEAARKSMLGGLAASGWHVCCIVMKMATDAYLLQSAFLGAPGVEEVRWLLPLRAGAVVKVRATIHDKRASRSRPEMGFLKVSHDLIDAGGKTIMTLSVNPMFARRSGGAA